MNDIDELITEIDINIIKQNINNYPSQKLCDMIVCDRYFGFQKEVSLICMQELSNRRINGDQFEFENYIDEAYNSLPVLNFKMPNLNDILGSLTKK